MKNAYDIYRFEIRLSGTGGQGIITLGRILGHALALEEGYSVTQTQSYGPEARGGASRSDLVVSTKPISYPKPVGLDLLVAMSQEACDLYYRYLKHKGVLLVDTTLVAQTPTNIYYGLPITDLARTRIKVVQAANIVALGAITFLLPFARPAAMKKSLEANLPAKILELNIKAFNLGFNQAKKEFKEPPEIWKSS